ncbi:MAG: hypothetical protein JWP15_3464 [Alphaproteobacteria bacterium]|nr:hypothetical protein [Alphaproteobacteria bacterium]
MTGKVLLIERRYWFVALAIVAAAALVLLAEGRPPICTCGTIKLWAGQVASSDNSQQLADWYSPSHIIHGFLFYFAGWLVLRSRPPGERLVLATIIEAGWEMIENSHWIIDRYRSETMALGYSGDSVINSLSDIVMMMIGFGLARRLPVWAIVALAIGFELLTLAVIRDNLTLNVLMLLAPNDAIRNWQGG